VKRGESNLVDGQDPARTGPSAGAAANGYASSWWKLSSALPDSEVQAYIHPRVQHANHQDAALGNSVEDQPQKTAEMISHIDRLVLTTTNELAYIDFYTRVMGMALETFVGGTPLVERKAFKFGGQENQLAY